MRVFFYGLFMDEALLEDKGIAVQDVAPALASGYALRIGERATLLADPAGCTHGLVMTLRAADVESLYGDASVAAYVPETLLITLHSGEQEQVTCYNLTADQVSGSNADYAQQLLVLATRLNFPAGYLAEIAAQA